MSTYERGPIVLPFPSIYTTLRTVIYQVPVIKVNVQVLLQLIFDISHVPPDPYCPLDYADYQIINDP